MYKMISREGVRRAGVAGLLGLLALGLAACVSSHVLVGKARPPISPDQVQVYLSPPPFKYEDIAILDTSSRSSLSFTAQSKTDKVMERLKKEAAKLGANGVLLQGIGDRPGGSVGTSLGSGSASGSSIFGIGIGGSTTTYQKAGSGMAIYVDPNQPKPGPAPMREGGPRGEAPSPAVPPAEPKTQSP